MAQFKLRAGDQIIFELGKNNTVEVRKASKMDVLYLKAVKSQCNGWEDAFKKVAKTDTTKLLDLGPDKTDFDDGEWEW